MIAVKFMQVGCATYLESVLPKNIQLRDIQKDLCEFFKKSWPKKQANVKVNDTTYDDFNEYPFEDVIGEDIEATVTFEDTTDPYFYDLIDRKSLKYTVEDEMQWELETTRGDTCLTLQEWMKDKTIRLQAVVPEWPMFDQ